jgi:hypothetical protein
LAKFSQSNGVDGWELREGTYFVDEITGKYDGGMDAQLEIAEDGNAIFSGLCFWQENPYLVTCIRQC